MSDVVSVVALVVLLRIAMVITGFGFTWLGYRLFRAGVYEHGSDIKASWGDSYLILKQAAPGTLFALFGVAVIGLSIVRGVSVEGTGFESLVKSQSSPDPKNNGSATEPTNKKQPGEPFGFNIQALHLNEDKSTKRLIEAYEPILESFVQNQVSDQDAITSLNLAVLGRLPTENEMKVMKSYLKTAPGGKEAGYRDILKSLLFSNEYWYQPRRAPAHLADPPAK